MQHVKHPSVDHGTIRRGDEAWPIRGGVVRCPRDLHDGEWPFASLDERGQYDATLEAEATAAADSLKPEAGSSADEGPEPSQAEAQPDAQAPQEGLEDGDEGDGPADDPDASQEAPSGAQEPSDAAGDQAEAPAPGAAPKGRPQGKRRK